MKPTRVRFGVLYFGIALAVIQYIDRVCISWSMPDIRAALGLVGADRRAGHGRVPLRNRDRRDQLMCLRVAP